MQAIRHVLTLVGDSARSERVLALGARIARRHGATLAALHAVEPMRSGAYLSPEAASVAAAWVLETETRRRDLATARIAAASAASRVAIEAIPPLGDPLAQALRHAATADLVVASQHDPAVEDGSPRHFVERLLVMAGTPLLLVPHADTLPLRDDGAPDCGRHVLVAWSPTRESVRALRDALPWLAGAERVEVVRFLPAGDDGAGGPAGVAAGQGHGGLDAVVAHLARHGVDATAHVLHAPAPSLGGRLLATWSVDVPIAQGLLSHAADAAADLLVMGGYGHPRAWELTLGGVTRTMLQSMTLPVLLSH